MKRAGTTKREMGSWSLKEIRKAWDRTHATKGTVICAWGFGKDSAVFFAELRDMRILKRDAARAARRKT